MSPDLIGMLLLSLLLLTSGGDVERVEVLGAGDRRVEATDAALVVTGGDVTVPADVTVGGPVHVLGGSLELRGSVLGDVLVLGGSVTVGADAEVTGVVRHGGGDLTLDPGASAVATGLEVAGARGGAAADVASTLVTAAALALVGAWWARRRPDALATVGEALRRHPVIALVVGALVAVTGLSVLVFMAFTLVLLPVSVLGLVVGVVLVGYGVIGLGGLLGRLLPVERVAPATATGVVLVVVGLRGLELVPVVGDLVGLGVLLAGLGAVLVTYLGLKPFTPVVLPG
jgi:hypothetical protein